MENYDIYVAACDEKGGIYRYRMQDGQFCFMDKIPVDRPMYLAIKNNELYAILRSPFENSEESGIVKFMINDDGSLTKTDYIEKTNGVVACHLTVGEYIYAVNYLSGSVVRIPDILDVRSGKGPNEARQDMSHTHYVNFSPDGRYIFATDLGADEIITYTKDLKEVSAAKVPSGHGARHLAYHENGHTVFCVNELMSTITVFEYNDGKLTPTETVSILPDDFSGENTAAAVRVAGDYVYASNRGHDSISCLKYENGILRLLSVTDCGGIGPRDFDFIGEKYMAVTNQYSNNITIFNVDKENLDKTDIEFKAECPICVITKKLQ